MALRPGADQALRAEVAKRRSEAIKLRMAGATYKQIAESDLYPEGTSRAQAFMDIKRAYQEAAGELHETVELARTESILRYERLLLAVWPTAMGGNVRAVDACAKLIDKIDDLTGTKAPVRLEFGESDIDRRIRELTEQLAGQAAAPGETSGAEAPPAVGG
jgi:hypothetical protein